MSELYNYSMNLMILKQSGMKIPSLQVMWSLCLFH